MSTYKGFSQVQLTRPKQSVFDLSHEKKLTFRMGKLIPVFISEVVPGDVCYISTQILLRLLPMLAPIYARLRCTVQFFMVPNRLMWEQWEPFITGGQFGSEVTVPPVPPSVDIGALLAEGQDLLSKGKLCDYLGVPPIADVDSAAWAGLEFDILPVMAYQLVWYEYYRDRNMTDGESADSAMQFPAVGEGTDVWDDLGDYSQFFNLQQKHWMPDYFTTAMISTQRGAEVLMPLDASVEYLTQSIVRGQDNTSSGLYVSGAVSGGDNVLEGPTGDLNSNQNARIENIDSISNSSVTINDFRAAVALQGWLERNMVAGSRYTESIQAHFGLKPQDSRLQRPEYLGGGRVPVKVSEVVNTAWSVDDADNSVPAGNLSGHGIAFGNANQVSYYVPEHGFIIGIMHVMPEASYQQGLPRMFKRRTFHDYVWPAFARLGEQPVYNWELYFNPTNFTEIGDTGEYPVFGYQSRYADWKWLSSSSHGEFRDTLLFWTLTRTFASTPVLGNAFLEFEDQLQDRIFAVSGQDNFLAYVYNKVTVKRALPYFGVPALL